MEFVATIFGSVFSGMAELVKRQLGYICNYGSNVQELQSYVQELQDQRASMMVRVRDAENKGENIHDLVTTWLTKTREKIAEIEEFQNDEGHQKTGCSNGSFPNLKLRHKLGRQARKMIPQFVALLQQSNFAAFSYRPEPEASDIALYDGSYESFKSRDAIAEQIMNALGDPAIKMIGICGQGGVGKTTLVKAVARKAKAKKLFNVVVIVNITSTPNVRKIQGEIADMLGLRLDDESEIGRAGRLKQRFMKEKENTLVILDDLWAGLDLNLLGIQLKDDDINEKIMANMPNIGHDQLKDDKMASDSKKFKILLTSRCKEVLSSEMEVKDSIFKMNVMEEEESEKLFNKVAGITDEDSELKSISTKIVLKCANLPLAIEAAGKALKNNKNKVAWKNALQQLEKQEMIEVLEPVVFSTMLSYDRLQSEDLKSIFLLCARLGKDPSIMYLVKYCIGLSIFQGVNTIKDVRDRTNESIKKLKDSSLLLDTNSPDCVTMHDMIRDAALSIAYKHNSVFTRRYAKLDEWPDQGTFKKYTVISLHYCDIIDRIPEGIICPHLKVFHLDSKDPFMKIPDKLFEGMKELRVLILTGIDLSTFPSSVKFLIKLRMLCLEQCVLGDNISIISELKNLRILSLLGSKFESLPSEVRQLGKLQLFDISHCTKLKVIPSNVMSKLNSLEELYMGKTLIQWGVERKTNHNEIATLAELESLQQLRSLDIHIEDITTLPSGLDFDRLDSYKIVIGDSRMLLFEDFQMPNQYKASRVLALHVKRSNDIHSQVGIKMLFKSTEQLFLGEVGGLQNVTYNLNVEGFQSLKHLTIKKNFDIQNIIYSTKWEHQVMAFPQLESICLYKLESLEKICNCQLRDTSFQSLKTMKVRICGQLKYLFSFDMARLLVKLETLEVSECDSLEDIVFMERQENIGNDVEDNRISFPQLRYLTLQSLSKLTWFYSNDNMESGTGCITFFNIEVSIPNLESLELSSINIRKVWDSQPLPSSSFQNLTKLKVNDCGGLKYLFSLPMVGNVMKLQSLFISGCDMMKDIFDPEDINTNEASQEANIFPQLKKIEITNMEELKTIWHARASKNSFCSLESVIIGDCRKLLTIVPPYMVGRFHNLGILEVTDCESLEEIFDFHQPIPKIGGENETSLRVVTLQRLPKLKHVWSKDPQGLLNFQVLQHVVVTDCPSVENLFPFSIANDLMKLEKLRIYRCDGMEEIVAGGDASNISNFVFKYPKLNTLGLVDLPKLRCFYQGTHAIELQALTYLSFGRCDKLEAFGTETTHSEVKPILSSLVKVISNLEVLQIYGLERKWLQDTIGDNVYLMHNTKALYFGGLSSIKILFWLLHTFPRLESLNLTNSVLKEVVPYGSHVFLEKVGAVVQLKNMSLWYSDIPLNIGFENGPILQRVEKLRIVECYYSTNLIPSSLALTQLSYLEVSKCNRLRNLLTSSTAKTLVQLTVMKVSQCAMMEEIVTVEENEEEIVFGKLKSLELVSLRNLTSFCNSQSKLVFRFPSLEEVKVGDCLKMEKFSEKIISTPNLEKVDIVEGEEGDKWFWEGDLNATIQKIFTDKFLLEFCRNMELSCYPELQQLWRGEISPPNNCFNNLRTLKVKNCSFLLEVLPSRLLPYFKNLEELQVSLSPVEVIFDIDGNSLTEMKGKLFHLKRMILDGLQNLKCIWSKDPCSVISFLNLKEIIVTNCAGIKTLFPASLARNLVRLKKLDIRRCDALEEIVGKEEAVAGGASGKFEFHYLTTLTLRHLPSLKFFYPGRYTLEFPSLESLHVCNCNKLEVFASDFRSCKEEVGCEDEANITTSRQSLFMDEKAVQNLETLTLNGNDMMMLSHGHFPDNLLHKLRTLELCLGDSHEAGATLPFKFFQKVPNLETLVARHCNALDEMFPSQRPEDIDHIINILAQVRQLVLGSLPLLSSIGLDNSWVDPVGKNLRFLEISDCPRLNILVPSSAVSFCNLKELRISRCHGLVSVFSSSVAKSLVQLYGMLITECRSITHVVTHESDESDSDEIVFERLKFITLSHLPSPVSFYSGNATLEFSALKAPIIEQCPKMKCFSQGIVRAPIVKGIQYLRDNEYEWHNYSDLNITWQKLFNEKLEQLTCGVQDLKLGDYPELGDIWQSAMSLPNGGFSNLKTLIVDGCPFLSHYVIPFHLLGSLSNLEDLQVQNCDSVRAIFEVGSLSTSLSFPLKSMTLEELPNLEQVWNEDPQDILIFQSLQHVYVQGCRSLKSLFPASMAHGRLESLEILKIECCEGLVEIIASEETASEESARNSVIFPNLTELGLWKLPELRCICSGLNNVEWPKLKELDVYQCGQLKNMGVEATITLEKVFPNLEHLSLCKEDTMEIWQAPFPVNLLQRAKFLKLHGFCDDSDVFPYGFFKKELLSHVEKFAVSYSNFKQIFTSERSDLDGCADEFFSQLKTLELSFLSTLNSIGLEHTPLPGNLEILKVSSCPCLINLAPSTVSFSNLRGLDVSDCDGLVYLFTSLTAKSLASLEDLTVANCGSMREIVAKEEDESDQDDITFENLKDLKLKSMPSLDSFYTGAYHLKFPCLEQVSIYDCSQMKVFSDADIYAPDNVTISSNGDLREMIEKAFKKAT